jgi:hypothetical protein
MAFKPLISQEDLFLLLINQRHFASAQVAGRPCPPDFAAGNFFRLKDLKWLGDLVPQIFAAGNFQAKRPN